MYTRTAIPVANDNAAPARRLAAAHAAPAQPVAAIQPVSRTRRPQPPRRRNWIAAFAVMYHVLLFASLILALAKVAAPVVVAALAGLSALGGACALSLVRNRLLRNCLAVTSGLCAGLAVLPLVLLTPLGQQAQPILLLAFAVAVVGLVARATLPILFALAALAGLGLSSPLVVQDPALQIQLAALALACAAGAWRSGSLLASCLTLGAGLAALGSVLLQSGYGTVQGLAACGAVAAALWCVGASLSRDRLSLSAIGMAVALLCALCVQLHWLDAANRDATYHTASDARIFAAILVAAQGVMLVANLARWQRGSVGWLGVALPQLGLAAVSTIAIDPSAAERWTYLPDMAEAPVLFALALGAWVLALVSFALRRHWLADRPVRTGIAALAVMLQGALLWPHVAREPALLPFLALLLCAAAAAIWLSAERRSGADPIGIAAHS